MYKKATSKLEVVFFWVSKSPGGIFNTVMNLKVRGLHLTPFCLLNWLFEL
jgi:hypothetical protein